MSKSCSAITSGLLAGFVGLTLTGCQPGLLVEEEDGAPTPADSDTTGDNRGDEGTAGDGAPGDEDPGSPTFALRLDAGLVSGMMTYGGRNFAALEPFVTTAAGDWGACDVNNDFCGESAREIPNSDYDDLYRGQIWGHPGDLTIAVPVPNGTYRLYLHNAELSANHAGTRVFTVYAEEALLQDSWDIYAEAGSELNVALRPEFSVEVSDGQLDLRFAQIESAPKICGIELLSGDASPLPLGAIPGCGPTNPCPEDTLGAPYCSGGDLYRDLHSFACVGETCEETVTAQLEESCGDPGCDDGACNSSTVEVSLYADVLFSIDFETNALDAEYTEEEARADFVIGGAQVIQASSGMGDETQINTSIVLVPATDDGSGGETQALCFLHRAGDYGAHGSIYVPPEEEYPTRGSGAQFTARIQPARYELYLSYNMMRDQDAWQVGNKMPHLNAFDFADEDTGLWGTWMIEAPGVNEADWYMKWYGSSHSQGPEWYDPDDPSVDWNFDWSERTWYNVTLRYSINDTGFANGFVESFINGKLASQWSGHEFCSPRHSINQLAMRFFLGGADHWYAPEVDQHLWVDDVYLFTYRDGYGPSQGQQSSSGRELYALPNWDIERGKKK